MEMVAIGSPSGLHAEHGIAAVRRGLHVLVEKPIDVTYARAGELISEAERAAVTLGVIFQDRLKPGIRRLKGFIDSGQMGNPILATAHVKWWRPEAYYRESRWRGTHALDGGGALMNQAVHTVDLLLWLFGPVRRVFGKTATRLHHVEIEDTAAAVLEFENGALGTIEAATSAYPGYARRIELTGSEGTAILDGDRLVALDLHTPIADAIDEAETRNESASSPVVSDPMAHRRVFEDFMHAVATRTKPSCDGREGRASVELIEAIYQASKTNKAIELGRAVSPA